MKHLGLLCVMGLAACLPDADLEDERLAAGFDSTTLPASGGPPVGASLNQNLGPSPMPAPVVDDGAPPVLGAVTVLAGSCVQVAVSVNKPAEVAFVFEQGELVVRAPAARRADGLMVVTTALAGLPPQQSSQVWAEAVDAQARTSAAPPQIFTTPPARPSVVISEVLANPAGSEYTQEFVELLNFGVEAISLTGFAIEDATGQDVLGDAVLAPGARALIVAEGFDPSAGPDPEPAAGTLLLRVQGRIGKDGLSNAGEVVTLRAPDGQVVSHYGGWVNVGASSWNGRSVHRVPQDDPCDDKRLWTDRPQPPTPGW